MSLYRVFSGLIAAIKSFYLGCSTSKEQALFSLLELSGSSFCIFLDFFLPKKTQWDVLCLD